MHRGTVQPIGQPIGLLLLILLVWSWGRPALAQTASDGLRQRLASGVLRWGGDADGGAPFQLRSPDDPSRVIGFEVELADALAEVLAKKLQLPLRAEFVQYEWVSLPLGLERDNFDILLSGFEITPENAQAVRFTRPYYIYSQQLYVRQDNTSIQQLSDCLGKSVGTLSGSAAERVLQELGVQDIVGFDGQVEPYLDLELGRLDAVLLDSPIAAYYGATKQTLKPVGLPSHPGEYGIAVRPADVELAAALDGALSELMVNGTLGKIYRRWRLFDPHQAGLARGEARAKELAGLGFDAAGHMLNAKEPLPADAVDLNLISASAERWTFSQYGPLLIKAAGMTVLLTVTSMALAMVIGLAVSLCRLYGPAPLRWLALAYVEFFRGIPLLLLLFFLYFGLSAYGIQLPAVTTAILGFGLCYAAYEAEIYRSSILAVPAKQWEAAQALGMRDALAFRRIIFPQAIRTALGPMTNDFVALFKDTSLVSVIAVRELTKEYLILSRSSLKFVELGLFTALLYLAMSVPLGYLSRYLERRWGASK